MADTNRWLHEPVNLPRWRWLIYAVIFWITFVNGLLMIVGWLT